MGYVVASLGGAAALIPTVKKKNCQSQCGGSNSTPSTPTPSGGGPYDLLPAALDLMHEHRNAARCVGHLFYNKDAFIAALRSFPGFGTTGDDTTARGSLLLSWLRLLMNPDSPCPPGKQYYGRPPIELTQIVEECNNPGAYCTSQDWPCPPGKQYYGRGPFQLTQSAGRVPGYGVITNIINGGLNSGTVRIHGLRIGSGFIRGTVRYWESARRQLGLQ
ncbi:hypothetical protein L6164_020235 [Bauhinia variegata]|uniref:Uncharacterized protein n=1 Tax=Bauhinia variegata TaxID=167791 RepID=A0ACB9MUT0_BAUVA|nr:hypothetical protein L6164_020235 [Bauhinia variegata]